MRSPCCCCRCGRAPAPAPATRRPRRGGSTADAARGRARARPRAACRGAPLAAVGRASAAGRGGAARPQHHAASCFCKGALPVSRSAGRPAGCWKRAADDCYIGAFGCREGTLRLHCLNGHPACVVPCTPTLRIAEIGSTASLLPGCRHGTVTKDGTTRFWPQGSRPRGMSVICAGGVPGHAGLPRLAPADAESSSAVWQAADSDPDAVAVAAPGPAQGVLITRELEASLRLAVRRKRRQRVTIAVRGVLLLWRAASAPWGRARRCRPGCTCAVLC
jgi:hypothetical protein